MEKKLYKLTINDSLERVMPPLQEVELELLTQSLLREGCRDPLVVWNGVVVDGHNRYRICHEYGIPFSYIEQDFEDESAAKLWIIQNQLARRNVPDFVRCEMVLPFEAALKAEAKKRQGQRNDLKNIMGNLPECYGQTTRDTLASMAGVSGRTLDRAKRIIRDADEATKEQLRTGEVSINKGYTSLTGKKPAQKPVKPSDGSESTTSTKNTLEAPADEAAAPLQPTPADANPSPTPPQPSQSSLTPAKQQEPRRPRNPYEIMPGFDSTQALGSLADIKYECPPDSIYETEPVEVFGGMPSNDQAMRGNAEMIQARREIEKCNERYLQMVRDVLRKMSRASRNEENMQELRTMVMACCEQAAASLTTG